MSEIMTVREISLKITTDRGCVISRLLNYIAHESSSVATTVIPFVAMRVTNGIVNTEFIR